MFINRDVDVSDSKGVEFTGWSSVNSAVRAASNETRDALLASQYASIG